MATAPESISVHEEADLLSRIAQGDRDAFRDLYARYSAPLFSLAIRLVGNFGESEELLQDAFVKIWRNAGSFDSRKSRPFTWAVTILRRTCIDHLRKRNVRPTSAQLPEDLLADASASGDIRRSAEVHDDSERLKGALEGIAPNPRKALELALFSGMTQSEIARRLEQPVGTIKSWIRRGLLGLRETLNQPTP
ncbi:MAG TPA: RNA polymerase sigma factor [Opitutaceae bacterium]|nr:RNA polymerase sigma factor [Opitutaceae bacterium]